MMSSGFLQSLPTPPPLSTPVLVFSKLGGCAFSIAQIAIGAVYLEDCPLQHYIPIYLIVLGIFGLALAVLSCLPCTQSCEDEASSTPLSLVCTAWNSLMSLFLFCWFIAGNVWIYSIYEPNYIKNSTSAEPYCDKTLYLFAFWTTNLSYIVMGLFLVCGFCFCLCGEAISKA
ncbi:transmembrane protein 272 [Gasterosteus aculeatus]|uniref:transmembrane protein 272-like n=1 Tax=Gasterosteus aculeatus aculeatus TaxID=481459 RepID=UPI001A9875F8|nr:transmembrane protein 272-like [Gasterosteus aculeatus aculeatus]